MHSLDFGTVCGKTARRRKASEALVFCLGELRSGPHRQTLFVAARSSVSNIAGEAPRDAPSWQSLVPRGALTRDHLIFLRRSQMFLNRPEVLYTLHA